MGKDTIQAVQKYYDANTRWFIRFGKNRNQKHIHQALWAEGVKTREEAANHSNQLILIELENLQLESSPNVLDLGCGIGGSMHFFLSKTGGKISIDGITLSKAQAQIARKMLEKKGDLQILEGNYLTYPFNPGHYHLAYAIESFIHAGDVNRFFTQCARALKPGGKFILIDDMLTARTREAEAEKYINDFVNGWMAHSLTTREEVIRIAAQHGLTCTDNRDLTPFMEIGRSRDRMIGIMYHTLGNLMFKHTYLRSLAGGYAKQQCLRNNWIEYRMMVFKKQA